MLSTLQPSSVSCPWGSRRWGWCGATSLQIAQPVRILRWLEAAASWEGSYLNYAGVSLLVCTNLPFQFPVTDCLWDLDLGGLHITIKLDSNRLKASNGHMEAAIHLKSIVQALGSLVSEGEERGNSRFPPHVSAGFLPTYQNHLIQSPSFRWLQFGEATSRWNALVSTELLLPVIWLFPQPDYMPGNKEEFVSMKKCLTELLPGS